jgi:hypothetical protein
MAAVARQKGRPKVETEPVMVRLPLPLLAILDEFRRKQNSIPTRPAAIRLLLKDQLVSLGYVEAEK